MSGVDLVVDGGQGQLDRLALLGGGHPVGGDQLRGQHLLLPVRGDVVDLAEQHRVTVVRLHVHGDGGGTGDVDGALQRGGLEARVLPGEVEGEPDAERGQLGEPAPDTGEGGDGGRGGSGGVAEGLGETVRCLASAATAAGRRGLLAAPAGGGVLAAVPAGGGVLSGARAGLLAGTGEGDLPSAAGQPGVRLAARTPLEGGAVGGVDATGPGHAEARPGVGVLVLLQITVEPVADPALDPVALVVPAVVSAGDPVDGDGCAVGLDGLGHGVGLAEREEGVALALEDERRYVDPVGHGLGGTFRQQGACGGVRLAADRDPLVHLAQFLLEPLAAAAGADEDAGPELLEHPVGEERVGEVPVADHRCDGVDTPVVAAWRAGTRRRRTRHR